MNIVGVGVGLGFSSMRRPSGPPPSPPDFVAYDSDNGALKGLVTGSGSFAHARASGAEVVDFEGLVKSCLAGEYRFDRARRVHNLWPALDGSETPSTQTITVVSGRDYQLRIGSESASGATAVCSGAFVGTLTGDGSNVIAFNTAQEATTTSLTVTITGAVRKIQLEDVSFQANQNPSEYVSVGTESGDFHGVGVDAVSYFAFQNGNTVFNNIVTEARGAEITDWAGLYEPASANVIQQPENFTATTTPGDWTIGGDVETVEDASESPVQGRNWWRLQADTGGEHVGRRMYHSAHTKAAVAETWTFSVLASADEVTWIRIQVVNANSSKLVRKFYNLATGQVGTFVTETTWVHVRSGMIEVRPGVYLCYLTLNTDTDTSINGNITLSSGDGNTLLTVGAGGGVYIQGAQLEKAPAPTSLMTGTTGAPYSRAVDSGDGAFAYSNWNAAQGTWWADVYFTQVNGALSQGLLSVQNDAASVLYETGGGIATQDDTAEHTVTMPGSDKLRRRWRTVSDFGTGETLEVGVRDIDSAGVWNWGATPPNYSGAFTTSNLINIARGITAPLRLRGMKGYNTERKGKDWVEANL